MKSEVRILDLVSLILTGIFILCGVLVSLHRYWQYEVSFIDFGQYDQIIWKVSRFQEPIFNHFIHGKIHVFSDHVTPSIFLFSPFYWFTDRPEILLILQAISVGLSGLFLYEIGKSTLKNRLVSISILTNYFLFVGLQNAVITEFHEITVMTLPFMASIWSIINNKKLLYFVLLIITLGFKEVTFAMGMALGISLIIINKDLRKVGFITILISLIWGILAFKMIMPYFLKGQYLYAEGIPDNIWGKLIALVDHPLKTRTVFYSLFSFSFLPVLAPQFWSGIFQDFASRFIPKFFITRWDLGMHYNAQSAVWLGVSSIFGMKFLRKFTVIRRSTFLLSLVMIINSIVLFRFVLHGPFLLAFNRDFYLQTAKMVFLDEMVKIVPRDASVMTHNNLASRFTHQETHLLTSNYEVFKPGYILLDLREGQSPNNFCCNLSLEKAKNIYKKLLKDSKYTLVYKTDDQFVFFRE